MYSNLLSNFLKQIKSGAIVQAVLEEIYEKKDPEEVRKDDDNSNDNK